jgi:hypothetical protein
MDTLIVLSVGVFCLGVALCTFFMIFLVRGKPIPGDRGNRQIIKYQDLELGVNSIMLLLIISTAVAVAPLALQYKLKLKPPLVPPPKETRIFLSGNLKDSSDSTARLAETPLTATNVVTKENFKTKTDQEGHFDFDPIEVTPETNHIRLMIEKDGYSPVEKTIVADEQNIPITLSKVHN